MEIVQDEHGDYERARMCVCNISFDWAGFISNSCW